MNWEEDKLTIVKQYFDCIDANNRELFSRLDNDISKSKSIYQLVKFIDDRLSAVWFLTMNDKLWDADIIDRSVLEALIKLNFIVYAPTDEEKQKRLKEFWNDLWEINSLKHSEHSKKHLNHFPDKLSQLAHLSVILTDTEEEELKNKWNRKDRKALEQKWSFSEMLFSLIKDYKGQTFEMMIGLAHEYRMCSHIAHGDETGINIIAERKSRPVEQRQIVNRGHFIKLLSNCLAYASWTSIVAMDFIQADKTFFFNNHSRIEQIKDIEKYYHEEVFNDPDYDKYK
ncbi:MAG: hypothetical protein WDA08_03780 [Weeksellaceae bacterium]|nr:DUF5677 domain-containing protein [Acholeplasmataceae bacterium]